MSPPSVVALLQRPIPLGTEFASDTSCPFLRFTFSTEPRSLWNGYNSIACLMDGDGASLSVTVNKRIFRKTLLI